MDSQIVERTLFVSGLLTVLVGVLLVVTGTSLSIIGDRVTLFGLFGLLALIQTVRTAREFLTASRGYVEMPTVEGSQSAIVLGNPFDRALERSKSRDQRAERNRTSVRRYLRATAIGTLVAATGASASEAQQQVEEGTWTNDSVAAALFLTNAPLTWRDRVRALLGRETTFQQQVRRAVTVLEQISGEDDD